MIRSYSNRTHPSLHATSWTLCRPIPLVAMPSFRVPLQGGFHRRGEVEGEVSVEVDNPSDVVIELPDQANIAAEAVRDLRFMILVDFIDQQPVLIQDNLHLMKVLLEGVEHFAVSLGSIAKE